MLLGHKDVSTTMVHTHVLNKGGHGVRSLVDGLSGGLYSLYKPEVSAAGEVRKRLVGQMLCKNGRKAGNFLYARKQSVFPVLYRLYNHFYAQASILRDQTLLPAHQMSVRDLS